MTFTYKTFIAKISDIETGSYRKEILKEDPDGVANILSKICLEKVFSSREINYLESTGYSVFTGLLDYYIEFLFHKDKKVRKRAKSLISSSIINCAIEENLSDIFRNKIASKIQQLESEKQHFENSPSKVAELNLEISKFTGKQEKTVTLLPRFEELSLRLEASPLSREEKAELKKIKYQLKKLVDPNFDDLDNYYKFRVILDFISGMTDQYALNHFQKISGQKIN